MNNILSLRFTCLVRPSLYLQRKIILLSFFILLASLSFSKEVGFNLIAEHRIVLDETESEVVKTAIEILTSDLAKVAGMNLNDTGTEIIIGTIGQSKDVEKLINKGKVSVKDISKKWEAFKIVCLNDKQLVVVGSTPRGTAYGVLELSRMMGVSPWEWWADVTPKPQSSVEIKKGIVTIQSPSVEYRGIFLNDEDWGLVPWSCQTFEPSSIPNHLGPKTYSKIFELLLRLRANTIWPAMHEGTTPFYTIKGNKETAQKYGIVVGTSHCEPMMRNNAGEWYKAQLGRYNFKTNRENIINYWAERLKEVVGTETFMTVGMRGVHDGRMEGVKTTTEYRNALHEVFDVQKNLLAKYINPDVEKIPQTMVLYKEVLNVYKDSLQVPDYVTLMWTDDNNGYIANLSNAKEQKRKGGSGIYYHVSYWGSPHDYLWLCSTPPALVYLQMRRAWEHHARKLWILNVGDIKPAEYDTELFMDMAWNIDAVNYTNLENHLENWAAREFGQEHAKPVADIMNEYYRLAAIRRPEHMGFNRVEINGYPRGGLMPVGAPEFTEDEARERLGDYEKIEKAAMELATSISPDRTDAYYQLVEYPVRAASQMNKKLLLTGQPALNAYNKIIELTDRYNKKISNGKWNLIMDMKPRKLPVFEPPVYTHIDAKLCRPNPKSSYIIKGSEFIRQTGTNRVIKGLGHSYRATEISKTSSLEYRLKVNEKGEYEILLGFIPMQPASDGDLRVQVTLDGKDVGTYSIWEKPFTDAWRVNVTRHQAIITLKQPLDNVKEHVLIIKALDNDIIIDCIKVIS